MQAEIPCLFYNDYFLGLHQVDEIKAFLNGVIQLAYNIQLWIRTMLLVLVWSLFLHNMDIYSRITSNFDKRNILLYKTCPFD